MFSYILNIVYGLALFFVSPILLYRIVVKGKYWDTISKRLGFLTIAKADIWIHGVSVGEVKVAFPLIQKFEELYPDYKIVISATSANGLKVARSMYSKHTILPFPLDFSWAVKKYLKHMKPKLIILVELEIWPNFLRAASQKKIPVILVNGRFSERSTRRYSYIRNLFCKMTKGILIFSVQNSLYEQRLLKLGVERERVLVTGNIKFDAISLQIPDEKTTADFMAKMQIASSDRVIIAGSTHDPEEKYILDSYQQLCAKFTNLRLIIIPRHPERKNKVAQYVQDIGMRTHFLSNLNNNAPFSQEDVIIGDTMGELVQIYSVGNIVFIGGSLIPHGGQNFIEPALQKKAVICGPHMQNFPDVKLFIEKKIIIQVKSKEEMYTIFLDLLNNPEKSTLMGESAAKLIVDLQGSIAKTINICEKYLINNSLEK